MIGPFPLNETNGRNRRIIVYYPACDCSVDRLIDRSIVNHESSAGKESCDRYFEKRIHGGIRWKRDGERNDDDDDDGVREF